jgi:peroxiredoxin-like protein
MESNYFYTTEVEWTGERHGDLRAPVMPNLKVDAPPEFKGHEGVWTPEHLFVASVNTCFMTTFLAIAENSKLDVVSFKTDASGKLEKLDGQGYVMTEITLHPKLVISNPGDTERAARILEKAERHCLISNSIKAETKLEPEIDVVSETLTFEEIG